MMEGTARGSCHSCGGTGHVARSCPLIDKVRSWSVASGSSLDSAGFPGGSAFSRPVPQGLYSGGRAEQPSPFHPITEQELEWLDSNAGAHPQKTAFQTRTPSQTPSQNTLTPAPTPQTPPTPLAAAAETPAASGRRKKKKKKKSKTDDALADDGALATCFNCDETGHLSRDCTRPRACFLCGESTHVAKNCEFSALKDDRGDALLPRAQLEKPLQEKPTLTQQEKQPQPQPQQLCLNCSEPGHRLKTCPHARKCFQCGLSGHVARLCPNVSRDKQLLQKRQQQQQHLGMAKTPASAPTSPLNGGTDDLFALADPSCAVLGAARNLFGAVGTHGSATPSPQFGNSGCGSAATTPLLRPSHHFSRDAPAFVPAHMQQHQQHQQQYLVQASPFSERGRADPTFLASGDGCASSNSSAAGSYAADRGTPSPFAYSPFAPVASGTSSVPLPGQRPEPATPPSLFLGDPAHRSIGGAFSAFIGNGGAEAAGEESGEMDDAQMQHLVSSLLTDAP